MKFRIALFALLTIFVNVTFAQGKLKKQIPLDKNVIKGKLDNGMTYYIYKNDTPKKTAYLSLLVNVGALLETDEQNGYAHMLEHMAFNGTTNFPKRKLVETLENNGLNFGYDINAFTTRDETCYSISNIPTEGESLMDTCLLMMRDISSNILIEEEELKSEKNIVIEEWRQRNDASARMSKKIDPVIFNNSKRSKRDVIGDLDIIKNCTSEKLREFYKKWYRPDLQCLIICGDVNAKKMEKKIISIFSDIKMPSNFEKKPDFLIDDHEDVKYVLATDDEIQHTSIQFSVRRKQNTEVFGKHQQVKDDVINYFCSSLISQKISSLSSKESLPFLEAGISNGNLCRGYDMASLFVSCDEKKERESLSKLSEIHNNFLNNGFDSEDFLLTKASLLMSFKNSSKQENKQNSVDLINKCKGNYISNLPLSSADYISNYTEEMINSITIGDLNNAYKKWFDGKSKIIVIRRNPKAKEEALNKEEVLNIVYNGNFSSVKKECKSSKSNVLLDEELKSGEITNIEKIKELNAEIWTLSNNTKIVYKFNNHYPGTVSFKGKSKGGISLVENDELSSCSALNVLIPNFGLGDHDSENLKKILATENAVMGVGIDKLHETIEGGCTKDYAETMFKLAYMAFEKPRFDEKIFNLYVSKSIGSFSKADVPYTSSLNDSILTMANRNNPRFSLINKEYFESMDFDKVKSIYKKRITNASDWTFYLVGDISKSKAKEMVCKYIANIKSNGVKEEWKDHGSYFPQGITKKTYEYKMPVPKSGVIMMYNSTMDYNYKTNFCFGILNGLLKLKLNNVIREKEGGTYGVSASTSVDRYPKPRYGLNINFVCDPLKLDHLHKLTNECIQDMIKNGVDEKQLKKMIKGALLVKTKEVKDVNYWNQVLEKYIEEGEDHTKKKYYNDILNAITVEDINNLTKRYFNNCNLIDLKYKPQK